VGGLSVINCRPANRPDPSALPEVGATDVDRRRYPLAEIVKIVGKYKMTENGPVIGGLVKGIGMLCLGVVVTLLIASVLMSRATVSSGSAAVDARFVPDQTASLNHKDSIFARGRAVFTPEVVAGR
jgi:hypothetical protein